MPVRYTGELPSQHKNDNMTVLLVVTSTLSWKYHYSGIRLVGLPGAGKVIQCIKEGYHHHVAYVTGYEAQNTVSATTGWNMEWKF